MMDNNQFKNYYKFGKIAPICEELCKNQQQFGIWHAKLSIDE